MTFKEKFRDTNLTFWEFLKFIKFFKDAINEVSAGDADAPLTCGKLIEIIDATLDKYRDFYVKLHKRVVIRDEPLEELEKLFNE